MKKNKYNHINSISYCILIVVGTIVWNHTVIAAPPMMSVKQRKALAEIQPAIKQGMSLQQIQQGAIFAGPVIESTGFEVEDGWVARDENNSGFICGPTFEDCSAPVSLACPDPGGNCCAGDPNPDNGWYMSISSLHCREPHIDTANPATGTQHLRFQRAAGTLDGHYGPDPGCVGFAGECRQSAFTPAPLGFGQLAIGNDTISLDIYGSGFGSSDFIMWWINDATAVGTVAMVTFDFYGDIIVRDYNVGYVTTGTVWLPGAYATLRIEVRNCDDVTDYYYGKNADGTDRLIFSHPIGTLTGGNSAGINRSILMANNADEIWDVDNYSVVRGDPCPTTCGADGLEPGEQCDFGDGEDFLCPGRCVPPGQTGFGGEAECTCDLCPFSECGGPCSSVNLVNGQTIHNGESGWFTFVADTEGTAIDMCDELGFDSFMYFIYNPSFIDDAPGTEECDLANLYLFAPYFNDDCNINDPDFGAGADPLARCHPVGEQGQACGCMPTVIGERYWVWERNGGTFGSSRTIFKGKRLSCDAIWENGACCRGATGVCEDDVAQADCMGVDIYTHNKLCETLQVCEAVPGACCDSAPSLGGPCADDVFFANCQGRFQSWTGDVTCQDVTCVEVTGACCNRLDGFCSQTLRGDCIGSHIVWTAAAPCSEVLCDPAMGACCNTRLGTCTDDIILADCTGQNLNWTKQDSCNALTCPDPFIPTVSQWGLVMMTLLLLIGAKVYFNGKLPLETENDE